MSYKTRVTANEVVKGGMYIQMVEQKEINQKCQKKKFAHHVCQRSVLMIGDQTIAPRVYAMRKKLLISSCDKGIKGEKNEMTPVCFCAHCRFQNLICIQLEETKLSIHCVQGDNLGHKEYKILVCLNCGNVGEGHEIAVEQATKFFPNYPLKSQEQLQDSAISLTTFLQMLPSLRTSFKQKSYSLVKAL